MPSAFTPNGDGRNDQVKPFLVGMKSLKRFAIYNRAGTVIYSSVTEGAAWDGTYKGKGVDSGVYVWLLEYFDAAGQPETAKGTVTLIR